MLKNHSPTQLRNTDNTWVKNTTKISERQAEQNPMEVTVAGLPLSNH